MINRYKEIGIYETASILGKSGNVVIIFLEGTLTDVYKLVHETVHVLISDYNGIKEKNLVEVLPMLSELYLSDYLKEMLIEESHINNKDRADYIGIYLPRASAEKSFMSQLNSSGKIEDYVHEEVESLAKELLNTKRLYIHKTELYLFGMMFGSYIHQSMDISGFSELCIKIKNMEFKDFFDEIGLSNQNEILDDRGYQKIFKSYERDYLYE